ncbi:HEAT repeat domain containing protein [Entamoeba histolytica HM-1:IMSS-B]|uniref:HEAT repeat domain containing protein n=6 Tax=Entamoeba histolytica TaxID=5759 RepID=C4LSK5_ENTH1|nr:HEAT repeat domain containing protein [Entamoeba histolytica HM-1:IMSS]EMD46642.1 HEAT repeat domain containing protein [Entamoeba histolytica KU27]EMH75702.1 HEAT repeat domain containing protein [Entamoeba histolytica HM-1:IMSS-B]ENY59921.1 HEAT repeat domain containing protein [Entamoeba histolytica HM-1:IMSS-A]GAT91411.1 heat repeat domain containing protein [Entamoeba histolytica]EAL52031.1 HEAT repeat domain containing protein [Entamoeba histolytica HM-1:IMSS]|eukprot:XP_657417.1 HEAT repeat domain containing protein [Entamoeba histolytica HM-1:IMSS]
MAANIVQAFQATLSPDQNIRNQGEQVLDSLTTQPQLLPQIIQLGTANSGQSDDIRKSALLCFGRTINKIDDLKSVNQDVLLQICNSLINCMKNETSVHLKGAVAAAVSNFAQCMSDSELDWNGYFPTIIEILRDPRPLQQMIALDTLQASVSLKGSETLIALQQQVVQFCIQALTNGDATMKLTVVDFLSSAIVLLETTEQHGAYAKQLIVPLQNTLIWLIQNNRFDDFDNASASFCELIENSEYLFVGNEINIATQMYQLCCSAQHKETQQSALEIAVCLISQEPHLFKKNPLLSNIVLKLLEWLKSIDNDGAELLLNDEDPIEVENWSYAEDAYFRIVEAVGGAPIKDVLFKTTLEYLNMDQWNARYAALVALSLSVIPGKYIFKTTMSDLMKIVLKFVNDPHPLVLHALLDLLEELIEAFPKMCRRRHFNEIMQVVIVSFNSTVVIVQDKACFVVNSLLEEDQQTAEKLLPFAQPLMEGIFKTLNTSNLKAVSSALSIIVFITRVLQKQMESYYPLLKNVVDTLLPKCNTKDTLEHKGKLIEIMCIYSIINTSFFPDSRQIVLKTFEELCNSNDVGSPMLPYILSGLCRFSEANDAGFIQYLGPIVQIILKRLLLKENPEAVIIDNEISVTNPYTEEKVYLLQTLFRITTSVKKAYGPYVQDTLNVLLPLISDPNASIKQVTAHLIPSIFEDAIFMIQDKGITDHTSILQQVAPIYYGIIDHLCMLLKKEKFTDNIQSYLTCLKMVLVLGGDNTLGEDRIGLVFESFDEILKKILDGVGIEDDDETIQIQNVDTDVLDDEEYEKIQDAAEEEDDWLSLILDITSYICKSHQKTFFTPFQYKLFPRVMIYFKQVEDSDKVSFAVAIIGCVIVDGKIYDFVPQIADQFIEFSHHKNIDIANNAIYFLGQFAKVDIPQFVPFIPKVLQSIGSMLSRQRTRAAVELADQVLICVGNIIGHYYTQIPNWQMIMQQWLNLFPAKSSYDEIVSLLSDLHNRGLLLEIMKLGNVAENIYRVVLYFARSLENENTSDETKKYIAQLIQALCPLVPQNVISEIWGKLSIDQRGDLDSLFHK